MSKFVELFTRIYNYANDIVNNKIIACKKHKQACNRFLNDLNKVDNVEYQYYFDSEELYRFYKWAELFKHRVGPLKGKKIKLVDFQLFMVGNIFCWKDKETKLRRFRKVYIQLARKNAKSQLLAVIASYICFLAKNEQAEVYLAGWDKEQSSIVYREILFQIEGSEFLKGTFTKSYGRITHLKTGSFIRPLSREAKNTGDGTNPSLGICDEYHAHKTDEIYEVISSGMSAREEPLMVIITTAGFDLSRPCFKEYQYVSKILDPNNSIENDEYFIMICELDKDDDIKDETCWIKANPIAATHAPGIRKIRGELKTATDAPEKMRKFLTKYMNMWVDMKEDGYMNMQKWSECYNPNLSISDFTGEECIVGLDLSTKLDLTSIGFEFKKNDKYYVFQHSFMPEEQYLKKLREGKYPFDLWKDQGLLTVIDGAVIDYSYVKAYMKSLEEEYNIIFKEICYDPYNATQFVQELEQEGYICVEIRQGPFTLNEPTKDFRDNVFSKSLEHNDSLLSWAVGNAVTKQNAQEFIMLDKAKSSEKIDPIASIIDAHCRAMTGILDTGEDIFYSPDI